MKTLKLLAKLTAWITLVNFAWFAPLPTFCLAVISVTSFCIAAEDDDN